MQMAGERAHRKCCALCGPYQHTRGQVEREHDPNLLYPCNRTDGITSCTQVAQLGDSGIMSCPKVDTATQTDAENVRSRPIDEIEIKVVCKIRGIENPVGCLADAAKLATRRLEELPRFCAHGGHGICFVRGCVETASTGGRWRGGSVIEYAPARWSGRCDG